MATSAILEWFSNLIAKLCAQEFLIIESNVNDEELAKRWGRLVSPRGSDQQWTYGRDTAMGPHLSLQSDKKIDFGSCRHIPLVFSASTNIWQRQCNSFSDRQIERMRCDRTFPPVGPIKRGAQRGEVVLTDAAREALPADQQQFVIPRALVEVKGSNAPAHVSYLDLLQFPPFLE
jgi:hypothetical protein